MRRFSAILCLTTALHAGAKEIALSFDDAPKGATKLFRPRERAAALIRALKRAQIPSVTIFANPCRGEAVSHLQLYRAAGHEIGNHSCTHPRLSAIGAEAFERDSAEADRRLRPLFSAQKFFRFPFLDEGRDAATRDELRAWLARNGYRNGLVSVDNDDYFFSHELERAQALGLRVKLRDLESYFVNYLADAADFYEQLALETLGRSPKHVMLLHERDVTVSFLEPFAKEMRRRGWSFVSTREAYADPLYAEAPENLYAQNGIISQLAFAKTGEKKNFNRMREIHQKLAETWKLPPEARKK